MSPGAFLKAQFRRILLFAAAVPPKGADEISTIPPGANADGIGRAVPDHGVVPD